MNKPIDQAKRQRLCREISSVLSEQTQAEAARQILAEHYRECGYPALAFLLQVAPLARAREHAEGVLLGGE